MSPRIGSRSVVATVLMAVASPAPAVCVTDVPGFRAALAAANGSTTLTTIMVARGTYDLSPGQLNFDSNAANQGRVDIAGGYNQDCSTHINNPALTVLDGGHQSQLLALSSLGGFSVRYLTLQNGSSATSSSPGLYISSPKEIIVDYNIIRGNSNTNDRWGGIFVGSNGTEDIHVDGNLLIGNTASLNQAAGAIGTASSIHIYVTNNTVADNTIPDNPSGIGGLVIDSGPSGTTDISNNIVWHNGAYDLYLFGTVNLTNNDIGAYGGTSFPSLTGNLSVDPKFNPGAYSLAAESPLYAQGKLAPPGGLPTIDIEGHPRSFMGAVDMGAYERGDEIFNDGMDH
jgi:hypothetical protein